MTKPGTETILDTATDAFAELVAKHWDEAEGDHDRAAELACEQMVNEFHIPGETVMAIVEEWERTR